MPQDLAIDLKIFPNSYDITQHAYKYLKIVQTISGNQKNP